VPNTAHVAYPTNHPPAYPHLHSETNKSRSAQTRNMATLQSPLPVTVYPTLDNEVHSLLEYKIDRLQYDTLNIVV
jgi:hypothetical protein